MEAAYCTHQQNETRCSLGRVAQALLDYACAHPRLALALPRHALPSHFRACRTPADTGPFKTQGIYLQQYTAQSPKKLDHLINSSLEVGVNTLVVDLWWRSPIYKAAIQRIQHHGLRYVPRITMF